MSRFRLALMIVCGTAAAAAWTSAIAVAAHPVGKKAKSPAQLRGVNFVSNCRFSHKNNDDPIVFPGGPNKSHEHTFVGSDTTNAFSTLGSLQAGSTSCRRPGDTAAYWMPTLIVNGNPVYPMNALVYYRRATLDPVQTFPQGLKVIAGDSKAVTAQDARIVYFNCGAEGPVQPTSTPPTCPNRTTMSIRMHVRFPNCWDGTNVDSADHKSHMAYSANGRCPADHPVGVPAIEVIFHYPTMGVPTTVLSSGGQFSGHADFFNGWNAAALQGLVDSCLNALRHCQGGS
jgi:hypothetical protein